MSALTRIFNRSLDEHVVMRWAVIAVILLLSLIFGLFTTRYLALFDLGLAAAIFLFANIELGLVLMLIVSLSLPISIATNTQTVVPISMIVLVLLLIGWLFRMLIRRSFRLAPSRVNLPLGIFTLAATISFVSGGLPWILLAAHAPLPAQLGGWAIFVLSCLGCLLVGNQIKREKWLKVLVAVFLGYGALAVAGRLTPAAGTLSNQLIIFTDTGSLFWLWIVALAGGLALFNKSMKLYGRVALGVLAGLTVLTMYLTSQSWLSGWLPGLGVLLALLVLRSWRISVLVMGVALALFLVLKGSALAGLVSENQYSIDTRLAAMQILLGRVLPANPLIGLGFANYYHYAELYPILGWYVKFNSHNNYVDIVMQMGVIGFVAFAWLATALTRLGLQLRSRVGDGFARGYVFACIAGLAGMLLAGALGDWFLPFVYNIGLSGTRMSILGWIFLGGLISIEQIAKRQSETVTGD